MVDESSGKKVFDFLLEKGYDVKSASRIMPGAPDFLVLQLAEKENRVLITNDKDFGELVFRLKRPSSGIILLRLRIDKPSNRIKYLSNLLLVFPNKLESSFIVVSEGQVRIREL